MPIPDDEQFGMYLKQFRPLVPEPLAVAEPAHRARRAWLLGAWAAAAAAILTGVILSPHIHSTRPTATKATENVGNPEHIMSAAPLTIRSANVLLAEAPSFKAAVDNMAFRSKNPPLPEGKQSAIAVLGKEKIKL